MVVLPSEVEAGQNIPQRYKVLVTIEDPRRIAERSFGKSILSVRLHEPNWPTGYASISYADYAVGRTLVTIVNEWFSEIDIREDGSISLKSAKAIRKTSNWLVWMVPSSAITAGIMFEPHEYPNQITPIRYLLIVMLLVFLGFVAAFAAEEKIGSWTERLVSTTRFDLSTGDSKKRERRAANRRRGKQWIALLFTGVLLAGAVGIGVNWISKMIFRI